MNNPFTEGSIIAKAFEMAVKGTTRIAINKLCEKEGKGAARIFWVLRRNKYGDTKWQFRQDEEGNVKLVSGTSTKAPVKKATKPAAKKATPKKTTSKPKTETKKSLVTELGLKKDEAPAVEAA